MANGCFLVTWLVTPWTSKISFCIDIHVVCFGEFMLYKSEISYCCSKPDHCCLIFQSLCYFSPGGVRSIAILVYVCPLAYLKTYMSKLRKIFSTCYLWPWLGLKRQVTLSTYRRYTNNYLSIYLLWRQCNMLCTSGLWMTSCFHLRRKYIGWQWRNFFIPYLCQMFSCYDVGQALQNVYYHPKSRDFGSRRVTAPARFKLALVGAKSGDWLFLTISNLQTSEIYWS